MAGMSSDLSSEPSVSPEPDEAVDGKDDSELSELTEDEESKAGDDEQRRKWRRRSNNIVPPAMWGWAETKHGVDGDDDSGPDSDDDAAESDENGPVPDDADADADDPVAVEHTDVVAAVAAVPAPQSSIMAGSELIQPMSPTSSSSSSSSPAQEPVELLPAPPPLHLDGRAENAADAATATHVAESSLDDVEPEPDAPDPDLESDLQPAHRAEALDVLAGIELKFALLRERVYVEKIEGLAWEETLVLEGTHPELLHLHRELSKRRDKRIELATRRRVYEVANVSKKRRADEDAVWCWWKTARDELQTEMISETNRKRRKLERDRRAMERPPPARRIPAPAYDYPEAPTLRQIAKAFPFEENRDASPPPPQSAESLVYPELTTLSATDIRADIEYLHQNRRAMFEGHRAPIPYNHPSLPFNYQMNEPPPMLIDQYPNEGLHPALGSGRIPPPSVMQAQHPYSGHHPAPAHGTPLPGYPPFAPGDLRAPQPGPGMVPSGVPPLHFTDHDMSSMVPGDPHQFGRAPPHAQYLGAHPIPSRPHHSHGRSPSPSSGGYPPQLPGPNAMWPPLPGKQYPSMSKPPDWIGEDASFAEDERVAAIERERDWERRSRLDAERDRLRDYPHSSRSNPHGNYPRGPTPTSQATHGTSASHQHHHHRGHHHHVVHHHHPQQIIGNGASGHIDSPHASRDFDPRGHHTHPSQSRPPKPSSSPWPSDDPRDQKSKHAGRISNEEIHRSSARPFPSKAELTLAPLGAASGRHSPRQGRDLEDPLGYHPHPVPPPISTGNQQSQAPGYPGASENPDHSPTNRFPFSSTNRPSQHSSRPPPPASGHSSPPLSGPSQVHSPHSFKSQRPPSPHPFVKPPLGTTGSTDKSPPGSGFPPPSGLLSGLPPGGGPPPMGFERDVKGSRSAINSPGPGPVTTTGKISSVPGPTDRLPSPLPPLPPGPASKMTLPPIIDSR